MSYAPDSALSPRRLTAVVTVVLLHLVILWAVKDGLARQVVELIKGPLDVRIIAEDIVQEKPLPPPPVKIETPPPFVPMPEIIIQLPPEPVPTAITAASITASSIIETPPAPKPKVVSVPKGQVVSRTGVGLPRGGLSEPEYPAIAVRLSQDGSVEMLLYVLENGRVGDAKVKRSSGFPMLDEAAVAHAKRAWRFTPAKENGRPIATWYPILLTFQIKDRR